METAHSAADTGPIAAAVVVVVVGAVAVGLVRTVPIEAVVAVAVGAVGLVRTGPIEAVVGASAALPIGREVPRVAHIAPKVAGQEVESVPDSQPDQ